MFWWRSIPLVILEYAHLDFYHTIKCLQRPASRLRLHENLSGEIVFFEASHYKILDSYFPAFLAEYPVSLSVFMTFPYFEPITFGMREQMKSCSSSTAWGFWVNWSFYYNVEFLIFIYFMLIFIYYNLVLPHCIKFSILWDSHTRSALGAKSWLDDRSLKTRAVVSNSTLRSAKRALFVMWDLQIKELFPNAKWPTSAFYQSVLGCKIWAPPDAFPSFADLWQNFWILLITLCQGARHDSALSWGW